MGRWPPGAGESFAHFCANLAAQLRASALAPFPPCFQPLFPVLGSSMRFTHTPRPPRARPLSRGFAVSLPREGSGLGCGGACALSRPQAKSSAGPGFRSLRALPPPLVCPPGPRHSRTHLSLHPAQGVSGWRAEGVEFGDGRAVPRGRAVTCSQLEVGVRQCVISGLMDCGFPYPGAPPRDPPQQGKNFPAAPKPLPHSQSCTVPHNNPEWWRLGPPIFP